MSSIWDVFRLREAISSSVRQTHRSMAAVLRNSIRRLLDVIPYGGY